MTTQPIESVLQNIKAFCIQNHIDYDGVTVAAATKTIPVETIAGLKSQGINICGENRVQEFLQKWGKVDTEWHFFGQLQTNKVKYIADKITMLHSLDREPLCAELQKRLCQNNIEHLDVLIEVNIADEQSKAGISCGAVHRFFETVKKYDRLRVRGLMSVMPLDAHSSGDKYYLQLKNLYDTIKAESKSPHFDVLSCGMSDDYLTALKYGANLLRLGRVLFGSR